MRCFHTAICSPGVYDDVYLIIVKMHEDSNRPQHPQLQSRICTELQENTTGTGHGRCLAVEVILINQTFVTFENSLQAPPLRSSLRTSCLPRSTTIPLRWAAPRPRQCISPATRFCARKIVMSPIFLRGASVPQSATRVPLPTIVRWFICRSTAARVAHPCRSPSPAIRSRATRSASSTKNSSMRQRLMDIRAVYRHVMAAARKQVCGPDTRHVNVQCAGNGTR